jgi:hypothetical protein
MSANAANAARGEAIVAGCKLRPSFAALAAAEDELGALFALVERAASGELKLSEMVALFWHCLDGVREMSRDDFAEAVASAGLAAATPALKTLLGQILAGR